MKMNYGIALTLLGLAQIVLGLRSGSPGWLLIWSGGSFVIAGLGYGPLGPRIFGKRADGTMTWRTMIAPAPYLLFIWILWRLQRAISREDGYNEVAPGLWIGGRPLRQDLPIGTTLIVDMTAEFPAAKAIRTSVTYICLPTLDGSAPDAVAFRNLISTIAAWKGPVFIHCALGHGRSATVVIAALIARGLATDVQQAEDLLKCSRPQIGLHPTQRRLLEKRTLWLPETPKQ